MVRKAHKRIRKSEKKNAEFQFLSSDLCILISPGFNSPQLAVIIEVKFQKHDTPRLAAERFHCEGKSPAPGEKGFFKVISGFTPWITQPKLETRNPYHKFITPAMNRSTATCQE